MRRRFNLIFKFQTPNSKLGIGNCLPDLPSAIRKRAGELGIYHRQGQSIIEVVIGLSVVVILAISLITTMLITQKTARSAQNNTTATKLAQQTIEQTRVLRDRKGFSYIQGKTDQTCYALETPDQNNPDTWDLVTNNCPRTVTLNNIDFNRKIEMCLNAADCNADKKLMTVTVSWLESGGTQTVTNKTFLANWCPGGITPGTPCP